MQIFTFEVTLTDITVSNMCFKEGLRYGIDFYNWDLSSGTK